MSSVRIGPCEYCSGRGGCVRDTFLEAIAKLKQEYGDANVIGGSITGSLGQCAKKDGIIEPFQCGIEAVIITRANVDKYEASGNIFDGIF